MENLLVEEIDGMVVKLDTIFGEVGGWSSLDFPFLFHLELAMG